MKVAKNLTLTRTQSDSGTIGVRVPELDKECPKCFRWMTHAYKVTQSGRTFERHHCPGCSTEVF